MRKIVLISCSAKKIPLKKGKKIEAKNLYDSALFKKAWEYAQLLKPDRVYILSAKHGLVKPDNLLATYNKSLNDASAAERKKWSAGILQSLKKEGIDLNEDSIIILAGENYWKYLVPQLGNMCLPYRENHCKGIGYILKFLNDEISK